MRKTRRCGPTPGPTKLWSRRCNPHRLRRRFRVRAQCVTEAIAKLILLPSRGGCFEARRPQMRLRRTGSIEPAGQCANGVGRHHAAHRFSEHIVAPDQIKAAGFDGALVYVAESRPGADFDFKPVTREYADGLRAAGLHIVSCYQYGKPGWPTRRITPGVRRRRSRCADSSTVASPRPAGRIPRRSSSASTRISTSIRGIALLFNGFEASTRCWGAAHRHLRAFAGVRMGDQRQRHRALDHGGPPVGVADHRVVCRSARACRGAVSGCGQHRVEPRSARGRYTRGRGRGPRGRFRAVGFASLVVCSPA